MTAHGLGSRVDGTFTLKTSHGEKILTGIGIEETQGNLMGR